VAAEFIMKRIPGVKVTPYVLFFATVGGAYGLRRYYGKIQDHGDDYYMQFNLVICGLDSVEARRWMNATLVNLVDPENPESLKPLIDGGTEGMESDCCLGYSCSKSLSRLQGPSSCDTSDNHILL
jgi:ubiquitin-activating enzyme E1 C